MELIKMYGELGISEKVLNYGREIEKACTTVSRPSIRQQNTIS